MAIDNIRWGANSDIGDRLYMEDRYSVVRNGMGGISIGMFDGHNGTGAAMLAARHMELDIERGRLDSGTASHTSWFRKVNREICQSGDTSGTTATVINITRDKADDTRRIVSFWAGDSPAYLVGVRVRNDKDLEREGAVYNLTPDLHDTRNDKEVVRMKQVGVNVYGEYFVTRMNGLMISRSLGDADYKESGGFIADPDSVSYSSGRHRLLLAASDGLLKGDLGTDGDALLEMMYMYQHGLSLGQVAISLTQKYGRVYQDNASAVIADLSALRN